MQVALPSVAASSVVDAGAASPDGAVWIWTCQGLSGTAEFDSDELADRLEST